ncbi:hypothetical protein Zmor_009411 [Zophobas morio]|uniref:Uncharacterized protein n=1 Tax=Zophobas morio TaxID=2755281 RepID=A0AA38MIP1_9CUCU|nr:hypothetical protein Zmor_009411 [Zophobas morio]
MGDGTRASSKKEEDFVPGRSYEDCRSDRDRHQEECGKMAAEHARRGAVDRSHSWTRRADAEPAPEERPTWREHLRVQKRELSLVRRDLC